MSRRTRPLRRAGAYLALVILLGTGLVALGKRTTNVDCPWDTVPYGGDRPYVRLFADRPDGLPPGRCFPAGHSAGGFSLLGLYFVFRERRRALARAGLAVGLAMGTVFAFGQWVRGAHFASHDLWSVIVCWLVAYGLYALAFRGRLWDAGAAATETPMPAPALALLLAVLAAGGTARAQEVAAGPLPDDAELERRGAVIGDVDILVGNVFDLSDPAENRKVFSIANHLHYPTREGVIRRQLLFETGTPYSRRVLEESERLLRANRYISEAHVRPVSYHGNQVDVEVVTQDVWTFSGGFNFGHKGGVSSSRFDVHDSNLLGTGMEVTLQRSSDVDRSSTLLRFHDPNLTRWHGQLVLAYGANSDGNQWNVLAERPFYALDTRWAAGLGAFSEDRMDHRYRRGEIVDEYRHQHAGWELSFGLSRGLRDGAARRWTAGVTYSRDVFAPIVDGPPPAAQPDDLRLFYPWVGYEYLEDAFVKTSNLELIQRTEDLYLGRRVTARLGFSPSFLSGGRDELVFAGQLTQTWSLRRDDLLLAAVSGGGRWGGGGLAGFRAGGSLQYYHHDFGRHRLFVEVSGEVARNLDLGETLYLGGDSGLRGYPLRYQDGDRRFLVTVEQRFYTNWHPLRLAHVGAAVFFDAGRAWSSGIPEVPGDLGGGLLRDVGFGLRVSPSRSSRNNVIHLDLAFPLDGDSSIAGVQWLVSTRESF